MRDVFLRREMLGEFRLFMELHDEDEELFFKYTSTRMSPDKFDLLLKILENTLFVRVLESPFHLRKDWP